MNLWALDISIREHTATAVVAALTPKSARKLVTDFFDLESWFAADDVTGIKCKQIGTAATNIADETMLCWCWDGANPTEWKGL